MVQLQKDLATFGVHGVSHCLPARYLTVIVETGRAKIAVAVWSHDGGFGDQESAGRSALRVVLGH